MINSFNRYNQIEIPFMILCNPDKSELDTISLATEKRLSLKYNALSEFSFSIASKTDNETPISCYSLIESKRIIYIENIGYFRIDEVGEDDDGLKKIKNVVCHQLEVELVQKKNNRFWRNDEVV